MKNVIISLILAIGLTSNIVLAKEIPSPKLNGCTYLSWVIKPSGAITKQSVINFLQSSGYNPVECRDIRRNNVVFVSLTLDSNQYNYIKNRGFDIYQNE